MRAALLIFEFTLVFGGTIAFCLWQIRSVRREMERDRAVSRDDAESGTGA